TTGAMDAVTDHYGDRWQAQQEAKHRDRTMDVGGEDTQVRARQAADLNDPTIRDAGPRSKKFPDPITGLEKEVKIVTDYDVVEPLGGRLGTNPDRKYPNEPLIYSVRNHNEGELWVTTHELYLNHHKLVREYPGQVTVLAGGHGDLYGDFHHEERFYTTDYLEFKKTPNVRVENVNDLSHSELKKLLNSPGRVIAAWCFSERSNYVIDALLHP
ncbi:MAG: hypothetical protein GY845_37655, partial [Planctomycetes bacterium]|nr:hypothetical protein [Planctomycetota bacterium]